MSGVTRSPPTAYILYLIIRNYVLRFRARLFASILVPGAAWGWRPGRRQGAEAPDSIYEETFSVTVRRFWATLKCTTRLVESLCESVMLRRQFRDTLIVANDDMDARALLRQAGRCGRAAGVWRASRATDRSDIEDVG